MPCYGPLTGYYSREVNPKTGKRGITFDRNLSFTGLPVMLPCGQCIGCRLERSRQWAIRCVHENRLHDSSAFVTLTYDNDHLPEGGSLIKRDMSAFCKRLHNRLLRSRGVGIRYYGCGEYGEVTHRPHYHVLVFGYGFPDRRFYKNTRADEPIYTSDYLSELWPQGRHAIGDVTFDSAAYVARYIVKKVTGEKADEHYMRVSPDGVVYSLEPEFTNMSRRPGIGAAWFDKYHGEAYASDSVIMNGREIRPPRFYDTRYELVDDKDMVRLKRKRKRKALRHKADSGSRRMRVKEVVKTKTLAIFRREI